MQDWLMASSDQEEAAALTAALVAIRSYPGEEGPVQRAVAAWLAKQGLQPEFSSTGADEIGRT